MLRNWHLEEENVAVKETIEQIVDRTKLLDEEEDPVVSQEPTALTQEVAEVEAASPIE